MSHQAEIERIDSDGDVGPLPPAVWEFDLDLGRDSDGVMNRIRGVVREIAKHQETSWPDDDYWKKVLPGWLTSSMPDLSQEECARLMAETPREKWSTLPWQFGSWIDAVRERGWKWWGAEVSGSRATVLLEITNVPGRVEAFKQILLAANAKVLQERY
ncbi:hypothetical protein HBF26_17670 [Luteibacter jiangsuensis]|uniref:Uncharacterized protein n=1 Tax=Luteibacter jiangsuensis TaxID=637577 RepID=A0ABX0Q896_9GAMM|nr:hypothetical protein [Luteibacter jiangsuensis]NID06724.1 hypothetical protein [Luteibacter jiangsuensis]